MKQKPKGVSLPKGSRSLWIKFSFRGKPFRENANTMDWKEAADLRTKRLGEVVGGTFTGLEAKKIKVAELLADLLRDYKINGKKSIDDVDTRVELHLNPFFGHYRASEVTSYLIARYVDQRQQEEAANASINRELAALKRSFNLAIQSTPPKVSKVPHFPHLQEDNVRTGFLEQTQYEKLADYFAGVGLWARALFETAVTYGWRRAEVLGLKVKQVDLLNRIIRLEVGSTKNKKGRIVTMTETVYQLLLQCCEGKLGEDFVFTRFLNGQHKPIIDFRDVWAKGCKVAGCPDLLFHDLRRTGARSLVRAGVAPHHAAKITGHKTLSMFHRYDIVDEQDIAMAVQKLETYQQGQKTVKKQPMEAPPSMVPPNGIQ